jgi:hypothetical protein
MAERWRDVGGRGRRLPRWIAPAFLTLTVLIVPWTAWLVYELPDREQASHWALAWAGFDAALAAALAATAIAIVRRKTWAAIASAVAGTLLACDAWFDVLTSHGPTAVSIATAEALFIELPLAALCFWVSWSVDRVVSDAQPQLERAGLRARDRSLDG